MHRFNNLPKQKEYRRQLRKNMTDHERILWSVLRGSRMKVKFRRQHSLGMYIADFYCPEKKLVIELDGGQHSEQKSYDDKRTHYFAVLGIRVLRVWNNEIRENLNGVLLKIEEMLGE